MGIMFDVMAADKIQIDRHGANVLLTMHEFGLDVDEQQAFSV